MIECGNNGPCCPLGALKRHSKYFFTVRHVIATWHRLALIIECPIIAGSRHLVALKCHLMLFLIVEHVLATVPSLNSCCIPNLVIVEDLIIGCPIIAGSRHLVALKCHLMLFLIIECPKIAGSCHLVALKCHLILFLTVGHVLATVSCQPPCCFQISP